MGIAVLSIIINGIITLISFTCDGYGIYLGSFMLLFWFLSLIGVLLYGFTDIKGFGVLAIIGFAVFVPAGFIGMTGMSKEIDKKVREEFFKKVN